MIRARFVYSPPGTRPSPAVRRGATRGLQEAAVHVLGESNKIVPLEEGTLQRSGQTDVEYPEASVYYDTPYAARQHEELTWRHDQGRSAKYLEKTLNATRAEVGKIVASAIRREVGS